jgi:predicted Holliday junction resolvase-like endonuclease
MDSLMTLWVLFIGIFIGFICGIALSFRTAVTPMHKKVERMSSTPEYLQTIIKHSFYNPENFRYLGDPIYGIYFEENAILFVQIKQPNQFTTKERDRIKALVETGKIQWMEFTPTA